MRTESCWSCDSLTALRKTGITAASIIPKPHQFFAQGGAMPFTRAYATNCPMCSFA